MTQLYNRGPMATTDDIQEARNAFATLQTAADRPCWIQVLVKNIRDSLLEAKADTAALDPNGRKTASEMDAEIAAAVERATLAGLQRNYRDFITEFADTLTSLKRDITALDETGASTEDQIQKDIAATIRRHCIQKAREEFKSYTTSDCAGWGDLCDHLEKCIKEPLQAAGAKLEDLDPEGKTPAAAITAQLQATRERLNLMCARKKFREYERDMSSAYADYPERREEDILKNLAAAKKGLADLDETGVSSVAEIRARLDKAAKGTRINGARHEFETLKSMTPAHYSYSSLQSVLGKMQRYLAAAGADVSALDASGRSTAKEMQGDLDKITGHLSFAFAEKELAEFENGAAPKALSDIARTSQQIAGKFNAVGARQSEEMREPDTPQEIAERIAAAETRARELYYEAGGKMPVMKALRFVPKQAAGG